MLKSKINCLCFCWERRDKMQLLSTNKVDITFPIETKENLLLIGEKLQSEENR